MSLEILRKWVRCVAQRALKAEPENVQDRPLPTCGAASSLGEETTHEIVGTRERYLCATCKSETTLMTGGGVVTMDVLPQMHIVLCKDCISEYFSQ